MIGYADLNALYIPNEKNINKNYLKSLGYNFGDKLKDQTHPIII